MVSERVKRPRMWLAASYTVEASWVMAICLGIVCMLILLRLWYLPEIQCVKWMWSHLFGKQNC